MKKRQLIFCMVMGVILVGCGQGRTRKNDVVQLEKTKQQKKENEMVQQENKKDESISFKKKRAKPPIKRKKIGQSRTENKIEFYDKEGVFISTYDIWENNPFKIPNLERIKNRGANESLLYSVPGLTKKDLKDIIPQSFHENLSPNVPINLIANVSNVSKGGDSITAILYSLVALEGYPEEDTNQGIYSEIKIINNRSELLQVVKIPKKPINRSLAITQDKKYLCYAYSTNENNEGCFDIYDLSLDKVVFIHCVEEGYSLHVFYRDSVFLGAISKNSITNNSKLFYISSEKNYLYEKRFDVNLSAYGFRNLENGIVLIDRRTKLTDTLLFTQDFEIINLKK